MPRNYNRKPRRNKPKRKTTYRKKTNAPRRMPYKSSRGKVVPYAYNVEVLQRNLAPQSTDFGQNDATASIPANFQLHMPCMFNAADSNLTHGLQGQWLTPKWLKSKFRISFDNISPDHVDSRKGFNLWMIQGVIKSTGEKSGADTTSYTNWCADILTTVGKQCLDSDLSANYLEFTKKNRNIRIIQKKLIKPNRNQSVRQAILATTDGESYTAPPPMCLSINHALPNFKQRVVDANPVSAQIQPQLNQSYIPFVAFYCNELTRDTGTFTIEQSSRFYYTDM